MEQERIWLLLGRKVSGEATMAELRELEELLVQYPELRYKFSVLSSWQAPATQDGWERKTDLALEKHMQRMTDVFPKEMPEQEPPAPVTATKSRAGMLAVLSLLVLLLGSYCVFLLMNREKPAAAMEMAEIQTRNGSRSRAMLPDGTEVWLNGGSRITYHPDMNSLQKREIFLSGEAYFKVAKDANSPFTIHTSQMVVNVLGTSFNIRAYPNEEVTEAALISGAVEVLPGYSPGRKVRLAPNQKIIIRHTQDGNTKPSLGYSMENIKLNEQDNMINDIAWCDNFLVFDNESFSSVALKMERWFGVKVHLTDKKLKAYRFTGTFKNESLSQILEALKVTSSFRCRITGNDVFINQ